MLVVILQPFYETATDSTDFPMKQIVISGNLKRREIMDALFITVNLVTYIIMAKIKLVFVIVEFKL